MAKRADGVTMRSYVTGFVASVVVTLTAYVLVIYHLLMGGWLIAAIITLAIAQLFVQLIFFLHLGHESRPRWNLLMLGFAVLIIFIVAGGSLWIMNHLNYNMMMPGMDTNTYMRNHEGV